MPVRDRAAARFLLRRMQPRRVVLAVCAFLMGTGAAGQGLELACPSGSVPLPVIGTTRNAVTGNLRQWACLKSDGQIIIQPDAINQALVPTELLNLGSPSLPWNEIWVRRVNIVQPLVVSSFPGINHSVTWNDAFDTFHNLSSNVTDNGSNFLSTLLRLQVNGSDAFVVRKDGRIATEEHLVQMVVFDFTTATATGDGKFYFVIDSKFNGMILLRVTAQVITAGTTNATNIDLDRCASTASGNACSGTVVDMLSTNLTVDSGENSSATAAVAAVINTANDDVATGQLIRVNVDAISTTPAQGLIVTAVFRLP